MAKEKSPNPGHEITIDQALSTLVLRNARGELVHVGKLVRPEDIPPYTPIVDENGYEVVGVASGAGFERATKNTEDAAPPKETWHPFGKKIL